MNKGTYKMKIIDWALLACNFICVSIYFVRVFMHVHQREPFANFSDGLFLYLGMLCSNLAVYRMTAGSAVVKSEKTRFLKMYFLVNTGIFFGLILIAGAPLITSLFFHDPRFAWTPVYRWHLLIACGFLAINLFVLRDLKRMRDL
ncbi:MAG TPA: hypothetical protein VGZ00_05570 [Candidatus Baltobacteraceae bacterium]|jgi:hypothetical protein|nr:hypothetical protein [Candidatus Baltobacteraceae bacterium]